MIKAIFFDIDNTIMDFMKMKYKSCEAAIGAMVSAGLKVDKKKALKELYVLYDKYGLEHQVVFDKLLKKLTGKIDYRIMTHGIIAYRRNRDNYLFAYPGTMSTLIELRKKYKLAIVTDAPRMNAWFRLVSLKIDDFFDVVITAADVRKQKNYAAPFKAALKSLNLKPEEAVMIGDRIPRDIWTAKSLGIHTCYAKYGEQEPFGKPSGADYELESIRELPKIVEEIGKKL